jgi:hypothetical protein
MEDLLIEATKSSPEVRFQAASGRLRLSGESYPENAAKFYTPVFAWLEEFLASGSGKVTMDIDVSYFNSSTSKALMNLLDMLQDAHAAGREVEVNWHYHEENETALECGEEFREDLFDLPFNLVAHA